MTVRSTCITSLGLGEIFSISTWQRLRLEDLESASSKDSKTQSQRASDWGNEHENKLAETGRGILFGRDSKQSPWLGHRIYLAETQTQTLGRAGKTFDFWQRLKESGLDF